MSDDRTPPRPPDYHVAAMDSVGRNPRIGGAWINPDESIYIKLDRFIVLDNRQGDLQIRLFVNRPKSSGEPTPRVFDLPEERGYPPPKER